MRLCPLGDFTLNNKHSVTRYVTVVLTLICKSDHAANPMGLARFYSVITPKPMKYEPYEKFGLGDYVGNNSIVLNFGMQRVIADIITQTKFFVRFILHRFWSYDTIKSG